MIKYFSPLLCNICIVPYVFVMQLWMKAWILAILSVNTDTLLTTGWLYVHLKVLSFIFWSYMLLPWRTWEQLCAQLSGNKVGLSCGGCRLLTCQQFSECSLSDHTTGNCCCLHCCRCVVKALIRPAGSTECVALLWFVIWVGNFSSSKRAHACSPTST